MDVLLDSESVCFITVLLQKCKFRTGLNTLRKKAEVHDKHVEQIAKLNHILLSCTPTPVRHTLYKHRTVLTNT